MSWYSGIRNLGSDIWDSISDPGGHLSKRVNSWSGADDTGAAAAKQQGYIDQGMGVLQDYTGRAQGAIDPYAQAGGQNFNDFQNMMRMGQFNPAYQQYGGPSNTPNMNPAFQGGDGNPAYQGYSGPMSSGQGLPQYQQFQGAARPDRMAGTAANVNMFMDPGYQFRLQQGLGAIEGSAANRGLLRSSGTQQGINDYAQGMASQEFGNAYGRMMQNQANQQSDYENDRNFGYGMNQDVNAWNAANADRGQRNFEGDRAFGWQVSQAPNNFNQQNADRSLQQANMANGFNQQNADRFTNNFNQDRTFNYGMNQDLNNWNRTGAMNNYNMWNGLANMGYNAAQTSANLYNTAGQQLSDLLVGKGNAAAAAGMTQGDQKRGLIGSGFGLFGGLLGSG